MCVIGVVLFGIFYMIFGLGLGLVVVGWMSDCFVVLVFIGIDYLV